MKILLLNDNPVVNKLVTLSAQKTSDELVVVERVDMINEGSYDLLVVDDILYDEKLFEILKEKIDFTKSLYICSRDAASTDEFSKIIKKPFLPTDLVELFSLISREVDDEVPEISIDTPELEELDELSVESETEILSDEIDLEEEISLDSDDTTEDLKFDFEDELSLDDDLSGGVLDEDELQEVQDLLDLTEDSLSESEEALELDNLDELSLESAISEEVTKPEELSLELDELMEVSSSEPEIVPEVSVSEELSVENEISEEVNEESLSEPDEAAEVSELEELSDESETSEEIIEESRSEPAEALELNELEELSEENDISESEVNLDDIEEELNLESEIEKAVSELTQEELDSELDEHALLDIVTAKTDSIDSLNTRDLKLAIGEEVTEETVREEDIAPEVNDLKELSFESGINEDETTNLEITPDTEGVAALKKLLKAISDKDVAASMKGMKITISIELGDA